MKLFFIKQRFNPYGGAELYLKSVINHLKKDFEIHLLTTNWEEVEGLYIHLVNSKNLISKDLGFALSARKYLKSLKDDFIAVSFDRTLYQHIYRASDGCHLRWLENRKKYLEGALKGLSFVVNPKHQIIKWLEKKCLLVSEVVVTNSNMVKEDFGKFYGTKVYEKCRVIYNGVDLKKFFPVNKEKKIELRRSLGIPQDSAVILFVGSGYFRKGLIFLLKAMSLLPKEYVLMVVGKEKRLKEFKLLTKKLQIDKRVFFFGAQRDVLKFYHAGDVFVLPTVYDPFSNTCLEALACGLPVITTIANGASELIINGKNGFTVELPVDHEKLAVLIDTVYKSLEPMKKFALETAKAHSIENSVKKFVEVIKCVY